MKRFLGNAIFGSQKMPRTTSNGNLPESPPPCLFPEGIQVWHDCPDAVVDVCFIHGLTGDRNSTWTAHGQSTPWPKSLLPPKLRGARILTYGYDAYIMRGSVASGNRLIDHASDFLNDLTTNRDSHDASNRSLIFVAHSLGGLVCKEAILLSRDRTQDHHLRGIFNHTKGIIFMGTPHQGSWMADWAGIPVSALGIGKSTSKSLLEILQTDNQFLEAIQEGFLTLIRNSEKAGKPLEVICFFEALPLPGWGPVVTKKSATFESYDWISLHANHRDMVKFVSAEDNGFVRLLGVLNRWKKKIEKDPRGRIEFELQTLQSNNIQKNTSTVSGKDLRQWLQPPDADSIYAKVWNKNHGQTGQWFINDERFHLWVEKGPSFLWINGFIGCGKTHMCATIINHLRDYHLRQKEYVKLKIGVAFFFFIDQSSQHDDCDCDMLRSLLWQLSEGLDNKHKQLREFHASKPSFTRDKLLNCLHNIMREFSKVFVLIDALDESPMLTILKTIRIIRNWNLPSLHLLVTSRDLEGIRKSLDPHRGQIVVMKNAAVQQDIANYIGDELQDHTVLYRYEERHREIRNLISERSQCAFRYAFSLFSHIGSAAGLSHLDELMSSLPSSLDAAYEDILSKIPKVHSNYAGRILRILCLSNRPLTVDELVHALAVDLGQKKCLDIERLFHINELRNLLGCLIECTWEKGLFIQGCITIQIAHTSVREYLRSDKIRQQSTVSMFAIEHGSTHMEIAQTCLLYILDPKISQGAHTQDKLISFPFASYAAKEWLYHYTRSDTPSSVVQELVVKLFTDQSGCFNTWIELRDLGSSWKAAADLTDATDSSATPLYHACLLGLADIVAKLVTIYNVNAPGGRYGNALQAAISQGHIEVVRNLLDGNLSVDSGGENLKSTEPANLSERQVTKIQTLPKPNISIDVNARGGEYGTSLIAACYNGNVELVLMLLRKGSNVNDQVGQYGNALAAASLRGHKRVVQLLLEKKAHFNASACGGRYGNALIAASNAGHSEIVQTLLSLDKNAISYSRSELFGNAFHAASFGGHTNILQDLLNFGADINAEDGIYGTALGSACFRGHMSAVQILVNYGAKINASSGRFGNALQAASLGGHIDLVKYLLDEGAKVNASGGRFGNALQAASFGTHDSMAQSIQHVLKDMLSRGVPILPQNSNALQVASSDAYRWDEKTLEKLSEMVLSKLPNAFSTMDPGKRDPFLDASLTDRGPLVQLLLEKGADVNAAGGEYGSALQAASSQGLETVVEILLNAKADVQASGGIHGSALELASYQNHEGIMKMLQNASSGLRPDGSSC